MDWTPEEDNYILSNVTMNLTKMANHLKRTEYEVMIRKYDINAYFQTKCHT